MEMSTKQRLDNFINGLARRNPGQAEFHQAVYEVAVDIIPFMFGQYKHMTHEFTGVLTGKGLAFGGSRIRAEATGYGCVFMMENMLERKGEGLKDKIALVSGSGNVAQYTVEKIHQLGGKAVTMSDASGFIFDPDGINTEKLEFVKQLKNVKRGRIHEYADKYGVEFHNDGTACRQPDGSWQIKG